MEIVWTDAATNSGDEGNLSDPATAQKFGGLVESRDVGYLISKNRTEVKLAVSIFPEDGTYRHSNTIPRGWIKEIIVLSRPPDQLHCPNDQSPDPGTPDLYPQT